MGNRLVIEGYAEQHHLIPLFEHSDQCRGRVMLIGGLSLDAALLSVVGEGIMDNSESNTRIKRFPNKIRVTVERLVENEQ